MPIARELPVSLMPIARELPVVRNGTRHEYFAGQVTKKPDIFICLK
jgi:hypothetical protein